MILIGQYDSSFVRRVGIALRIYELAFEHRPWSVFSDRERVQAFNPLMRFQLWFSMTATFSSTAIPSWTIWMASSRLASGFSRKRSPSAGVRSS